MVTVHQCTVNWYALLCSLVCTGVPPSVCPTAGAHIVSCCEGGIVVVWSASDATCQHTLKDHTGDINAVGWSPAEAERKRQHMLATASQDQTVR